MPRDRRSELDDRAEKESSSFYSSGESLPFGCHLRFGDSEWDAGRMIFGKENSAMFPGEKELIAFWYDDCHAHYGDIEPGETLRDPISENV